MAESTRRPSLAADFFGCLEAAVEVVKLFKEKNGRAPSEIELRAAAQMFAGLERSGGQRPVRAKKPKKGAAL